MKSYDCPDSNYVLINSQELDVLLDRSKPAKSSSSNPPILEQLWGFVLNTFARSQEPRIYRKHDRNGNLYFQVYNPSTNSLTRYNSEQEVRVWLDQRYYE